MPKPDPQTLFAYLWNTKYAPAYAAEHAEEERRRAEAFVDAPRLVAGHLIRPITGYDLLILDGHDHPLVGSPERVAATTPAELAAFLWLLRAETPGWSEARRLRKLRRTWVDRGLIAANRQPTSTYLFTALPEAVKFMEEAFADSAAPGTSGPSRPSSTSFLAPLVITLACETGWSESTILALPLARLWQYLAVIRRRHADKPAAELSPSHRHRGDCLAEVNAIMAGRLSVPTGYDPPASAA